ncbi:hypothetical protein PI124_g14177 [Phytophthora idaei]|nr:hypothetical protein PI125_g12872 [Phytophthora idaei]KAG3149616.1 hypothetical protein PI126_g11934 [Phytophthora idaei]KAG3240948.1 hypothetical protein PI124_g14177 [Phytophthora idaei]
MVSRWAGTTTSSLNTIVKRWQVEDESDQVQLRPLDDDSKWPNVDDIHNAQAITHSERPTYLAQDTEGNWRDKDKRLWIHTHAEVLLTRLMVISHCGKMGHRGVKVMINHPQKHFNIEKLEQKARGFCARCLLCCHVKGGGIIPRPWGETYRAKERNEALHMDYLFIG